MICDTNTEHLCIALNNLKGIEVVTGLSYMTNPRYQKRIYGNYIITMKVNSSDALFIPTMVIETLRSHQRGKWEISTRINFDIQDKIRYVFQSTFPHSWLECEARNLAYAITDLSINKNFLRNWQVDNNFSRNEGEKLDYVHYISLDREEELIQPQTNGIGRIRFENRDTNIR